MMLVNYRDEGDGGRLGRDYLRQTISVEEEKMHHGHADENSISLLMSGGSVLLTMAGTDRICRAAHLGPGAPTTSTTGSSRARTSVTGRRALYEFLRNSGGYRRVRTQKIDFLNLREADCQPLTADR
jgi:hypothetical protein